MLYHTQLACIVVPVPGVRLRHLFTCTLPHGRRGLRTRALSPDRQVGQICESPSTSRRKLAWSTCTIFKPLNLILRPREVLFFRSSVKFVAEHDLLPSLL